MNYAACSSRTGARAPATQAMIEVLVEAARRYDLGETRLALVS